MTKPFAVLVDLESTGTNVNVDTLLEIGAIAVDEELNNLGELSLLIHVQQAQLLVGTWGGFWKMHSLNGLITEATSGDGCSKQSADFEFERWLKSFGFTGKDVVLAGNSIGQFDIPMIHAQLPFTAAMLSHRAIDISAQARELVRVVNFERREREMSHRGLADCRLELEEWRDQGVFLRNMRDAASKAQKTWGHELVTF